jgi:hypothetical protein
VTEVVPKNWSGLLTEGSDGRLYSDPADAPGNEWQLPAGHFMPAKMPPVIILPRPDGETNVWERHRRAPDEEPWSCPVTVQGGAWPFHYEILDGDGSGVTIGEDYGDANYGVMRIEAPVIGVYTITVRVTDQDLTEVEREFTLEVIDKNDTDYFLWVDVANGDNSDPGTFDEPLETINGWYLTVHTNSDNTGKQIHYKAGTYTMAGITPTGSSNQNISIRAAKPLVHVAYDGDTVTFDMGNVVYWIFESNVVAGCYFGGITFTNPRVSEAGVFRKQFLRIETMKTRFTTFGCTFDGDGDTSSTDGSNSSCVMYAGTGTLDNYGATVNCTFHNCDNMDFVLYYRMSHCVAEGCIVTGTYGGTSNPSWGFFIKGFEDDHFTFRNLQMIGDDKVRSLFHMSAFTGHLKTHVEICWCNGKQPVVPPDQPRGSGTITLGEGESVDAGEYGPFWSYRNNWYVDHFEPTALEDGPFTFEHDVIQCNASYVATDGFNIVDSPDADFVFDLPAVASSDLLDETTNLLIGAARTLYLGTEGCEVSA